MPTPAINRLVQFGNVGELAAKTANPASSLRHLRSPDAFIWKSCGRKYGIPSDFQEAAPGLCSALRGNLLLCAKRDSAARYHQAKMGQQIPSPDRSPSTFGRYDQPSFFFTTS